MLEDRATELVDLDDNDGSWRRKEKGAHGRPDPDALRVHAQLGPQPDRRGTTAGIDFEVASAGTEASGVDPYAIRVLAESGIDWSGARSKAITEFLDERFDYVIIVCDRYVIIVCDRARETCPVFPGSTNTLHWDLDDPSEVSGTDEQRLTAFRRTEQDVAGRLRPFIGIALR